MEIRRLSATRRGGVSVRILFLVAVWVVVAGVVLFSRDYERSLLRADCLFLSGYLSVWEKSGRPQGEAFIKFQQGRPPEIQMTNRVLQLGGVVYRTEFASTNLRGGRDGVLYITDHGVLLLEGAGGRLKVVDPVKGK